MVMIDEFDSLTQRAAVIFSESQKSLVQRHLRPARCVRAHVVHGNIITSYNDMFLKCIRVTGR